MTAPHPRILGIVLVTLSALGWSTAGLFTRLVSAEALVIIGWRGAFGAVLIVAYLGWRDGPAAVRTIVRPGWAGFAVATLATLSTAFYIQALLVTSVADVVVIYATTPFITAGLAWLAMRERPARSTVTAAAMALGGVALTAAGGLGGSRLTGLVLAIGMTTGMAAVTVLSRRFRAVSMIPATAHSALQLGVLGALVSPMAAVSARDLAVLAAFAAVQAAAFACYVEGARRLEASRTALLSAADVPLAPLWVWLAVGEAPASATVAGGFVVLAAVLWDVRRAAAVPAPA